MFSRDTEHKPYSGKYNITIQDSLNVILDAITSSLTWMGSCCDDTPLVDIWSVDLDCLIGAVSSVPVMTSSHIDSVFHYAGSSISNALKGESKFDLTQYSHP